MDWIFGVGNKNKNDPKNISQLLGAALPPPDGTDPNKSGVPGAGPGGSGGNAGSGAQTAYRFDSTALERAAAAAKELEKSSKVICDCFKIKFYYLM